MNAKTVIATLLAVGVGLAFAVIEYRPQLLNNRPQTPEVPSVDRAVEEVEETLPDAPIADRSDTGGIEENNEDANLAAEPLDDPDDDEWFDDDELVDDDWDTDEWTDADWDEDDEFGFDVAEMAEELKDDPDYLETLEEMRTHPDPKIRELAAKLAPQFED